MKYFYGLLLGALCLVGVCAAGDQQNQNTLQEQRASSSELDKQIDILAKQIISSLDAQKTRKIAVIEFTSLEGNVSGLGKYLAEELTTRLFRTGRFLIIERQLMKKMMEEQKLNATGLIDAKTASKFGQILGVDALTTGTIADLNTSVKINARLIAVETGSVFAVASVKVPMNKEVEILLGKKHGAAGRSDVGRFDGTWDVIIACSPHEGALGYTYQLTSSVKDGVFHGQHGTDGIGPCLTLNGKINPDGSAVIMANGLTGNPKYSINNVSRSKPYSYHIDAIFTDSRGTGKRIQTRSCNLTFLKR
ncbi:MAG: FlgO family outer membrane protein [Syntrophus sp. (in: bacteria)]